MMTSMHAYRRRWLSVKVGIEHFAACCVSCRCFPKFPAEFTTSLYSMANTTSGVLSSAVSTAQAQWTSGGPLFSNYVADISKGILIVVIGGLACGMVMSLVRRLRAVGPVWSAQQACLEAPQGTSACRGTARHSTGRIYILHRYRRVAGHHNLKLRSQPLGCMSGAKPFVTVLSCLPCRCGC